MIKHLFIDKQNFKNNKSDYTKLLQIFHDVLTEEDIENQLQNGVFFNLIFENDKPATLTRWSIADNRKTVYLIRRIDTLPEFQGKGYGVQCINEGIERLKEYGCKKIISMADVENKASIKMHLKAGFEKLEKSSYKNTRYGWDTAVVFSKSVEKTYDKE